MTGFKKITREARQIVPGLPKLFYLMLEELGIISSDEITADMLANSIKELLKPEYLSERFGDYDRCSYVLNKYLPLLYAFIRKVAPQAFCDDYREIINSCKWNFNRKLGKELIDYKFEHLNNNKAVNAAATYLFNALQCAYYHNLSFCDIFDSMSSEDDYPAFSEDEMYNIINNVLFIRFKLSFSKVSINYETILNSIILNLTKYVKVYNIIPIGSCDDGDDKNSSEKLENPDSRIPFINMTITFDRIVVNDEEVWNIECGWILPGNDGRKIDPARGLKKPE